MYIDLHQFITDLYVRRVACRCEAFSNQHSAQAAYMMIRTADAATEGALPVLGLPLILITLVWGMAWLAWCAEFFD